MPDIDSDFRTDIKDVLLVYLKKKYGERAVAQILTKSFLQGKSAIDKVVMILGDRDTAERKRRHEAGEKMAPHEVRVESGYDSKGEYYHKEVVIPCDYRNIADKLKKKPGVDFDKKSMAENRDVLMAGADSDIEREIVEKAIIMDNDLDHTGLHAAGVIISDNDDLAEYIPVAWDVGFETWKTQCDMVQCESKHGLLKMDLLLLKTLDIVTYAARLIEKNHGIRVDIENLPFEQAVFKNIYAKGDTKDVFQFESGGMIKYLRQLNPDNIEDIIAMNALYRPGPMDSIPAYIEAKNSGNIVYDCPELEPILKETYGQLVYQEQVMRVVRDLAGYSMGRSDLVRRAMAKKHMDELVAEQKNFVYGNEKEGIRGCVPAGISEEAANKIFDKMIAFASYAFNKSHAAVYSVTSYMTAWLKYHYPTEFYCAVLNYVGAQKEIPAIIADAKRHNIRILPPDINKSEANFSTEKRNVRFGLRFLANAKNRANALVDARESGFKSFKAFVQAKPGKQLAEACILSGACDAYIDNPEKRSALLVAYNVLSEMYDNIVSAEDKIANATSEEAKRKAEILRDDLIAKWELYELPEATPMSLMDRLSKEQEIAAVYFSGDPLDSYEIPERVTEIADMDQPGSEYSIAAVMSDSKMLKTKKGGEAMMSCRLTDRSGTIAAIIFPRAYSALKDNLQVAMEFKGKYTVNDDEEAQLIISDAKPLPDKASKILVWFGNKYNETRDLLKANANSSGYEAFIVSDKGKAYRVGCRVTEEFCIAQGLKYTISQ